MLEFSEADHVYKVKGITLPSVTQCLSTQNTKWICDPWYLRRGSLVHKATEMFDLGDLDENSIDPGILPYFNNYKKFRKETNFNPDVVERRMYSKGYRYAGTIDRVGRLNSFACVLDLKSGAGDQTWDEIQLAAYYYLARENNYHTTNAFVLYLGGKTYHLREVKELYRKFTVFLACLTIFNFKKEEGKIGTRSDEITSRGGADSNAGPDDSSPGPEIA